MIAGYSLHARRLTPRMLDVLEAAASGRTVTQTARELGVSESTVRTLRAALCARAGAPNLTAAVYLYGRGELS